MQIRLQYTIEDRIKKAYFRFLIEKSINTINFYFKNCLLDIY